MCVETGCQTCELHKQSATIDDTSPSQSWISGEKSCYLSVSADCNPGNKDIRIDL